MNWIDIVLAIVLILAAWAGWKRGFIKGFADLLTWIGSITLAFVLYPYMAKAVGGIVRLHAWLLPVAFILTIVITRFLMGIITKRLLNIIPEKTNHDTINRYLGIIPGVINGLVYATVLAALLLVLPLKKSITTETQKSVIAKTLSAKAKWANKKLAPVFDEAVRQTMNSHSTSAKNGAHEETKLSFTLDDPEIRPALEAKMLELINNERAKEGLRPLKADSQETMVARAHSKDMFARGYFAHMNPDGKNPFERMKAANIRYSVAGENLALAQTLEIAHNNLMKSPGHRANIMNPAFGRVGIGIQDGGFYGLMISQEFRN